jgi:site-specific recombinase XerD
MSDEAVRASLKRIKNNAKIDRRIYPHLFRKTTATNIVKRGGSVHDAGEYLGHKYQSVTGKHYNYIGEEHTRNIFEKYVATV